jgi:hypothetical protein
MCQSTEEWLKNVLKELLFGNVAITFCKLSARVPSILITKTFTGSDSDAVVAMYFGVELILLAVKFLEAVPELQEDMEIPSPSNSKMVSGLVVIIISSL